MHGRLVNFFYVNKAWTLVNLAKFGGTIGEALPKFTYIKNYAMYSELIFVGYKKNFTKWKQEIQNIEFE